VALVAVGAITLIRRGPLRGAPEAVAQPHLR
jgi:hypothetical protein